MATGNPRIALYEPLVFRRRGKLKDHIQNAFHDALNRGKQDPFLAIQAIYEYAAAVFAWAFVGEDVSDQTKYAMLLRLLKQFQQQSPSTAAKPTLLQQSIENLIEIFRRLQTSP